MVEVLNRLRSEGVAVQDGLVDALERYNGLIREWNRAVSLVSAADLEHLEERHTVDSLSLTPVVKAICGDGGPLLDIGSGAGFPAIPVKLALPNLRVVLVERSERKAGFLRKATGALGLRDVEIRVGEFPRAVAGVRPEAVTARAVERPERLLLKLGPFLEAGAVFLCQAGDPRNVAPRMFHVEPHGQMFHVEHILDGWSEAGLRRGELYLLSREAGRHPRDGNQATP